MPSRPVGLAHMHYSLSYVVTARAKLFNRRPAANQPASRQEQRSIQPAAREVRGVRQSTENIFGSSNHAASRHRMIATLTKLRQFTLCPPAFGGSSIKGKARRLRSRGDD